MLRTRAMEMYSASGRPVLSIFWLMEKRGS